MTIFDNLKAEIHKAEVGFAKDEKWVIAEINKGWALLRDVGHTVEVDIANIFIWIQSHQAAIISTLHDALKGAALIGSIIPHAAPAVAAATLAIDVATAAVDALSKAVIAGQTPMHVAVNAYHAVKDAQSAVNAVIKQATSQPAARSAS